MFCGTLLLTFSVPFPSVWAGGLTISPVMIELDSPRKAVAVTLRNSGDTTLTFQSRVLVWQQVGGADRYLPTDTVLVAPSIIEIPPQSSQVFRVALRSGDPTRFEQSFRLLLEDVSRPEPGDGKPAIALRLIHSLPLFVAPAGKTVMDLRWSPCAPEGQSSCLRLSNVGNRHVKVRSLTISGERWQRHLNTPATLLAGAWREWRFDHQQGEADITAIRVQNDREVLVAVREIFESPTDGTRVVSTQALPSACTPEALEAILHAQATAQGPSTLAADRITDDLQSCAGSTAGESR